MVVMGEKDRRPFSIASSPTQVDGQIELHVGASEHNTYAAEVIDKMEDALVSGTDIIIDVPHGSAWFKASSDKLILLIAGGTGFSYVRSILNYCIVKGIPNPIFLYWGGKSSDQLYEKEKLEDLASLRSNITFVPVIEKKESNWPHKRGNVLEAVEGDFDSLTDFDIYLAGRFEMVTEARRRFTLYKAANRENMYSDAYCLSL